MPEPTRERVTCPGCGKGYRWQDRLVGRIVPCKQCDTQFTVPQTPGVGLTLEPTNDDGMYELDLASHEEARQVAVPPVAGKCPNCNSPVKDHAVICINCGFNMQLGMQMAKPQVAELDPKERKIVQREAKRPLRGMVLVRTGLWLSLISLLLFILFIPIGTAGLFMSDALLIAAGICFLLSSLCGFVGGLLCLAVPKESRARPIAVGAVLCGIASLTLYLLIEYGPLDPGWNLATNILGQLETIGFLWFFIALANYLEFDQITERAVKVFKLYISLIVAQFIVYLPICFFGCFALLYIIAVAVYTLVLYALLLIDLNNALSYRIAEQKD